MQAVRTAQPMPDQAARTATRDFAYHSTDAYANGNPGALEHPPPTAYLNSSDHYHAGGATNASNVPSAIEPSTQEAGLSYPDYTASEPQPGAPYPPNYGFNSGGSLVWDWNNSIEFPEFTSQYEPQGELVQEPQPREYTAQGFGISLPVTTQEPPLHSPQPVRSTGATSTQNPLSPPPKPAPPRPAIQTSLKRKAGSEPNSAVSQNAPPAEPQAPPAKRIAKSTTSSLASPVSPSIPVTREGNTSMPPTSAAVAPPPDTPAPSNSTANTEIQRRKEPSKGTGPAGRVIDVSKLRRIVENPAGGDNLPAGKVFPIQIGSELFRLSGASISSDAPSYFSHFFGEQLRNNAGRAGDLRTLYIDRDPVTFKDISLHLQGYHIKPRDNQHFVRLFADAQFYSLPRLIKQLFNTDIFIRVGQRDFQIPRDLFSSPGDSPNYFSLGFAHFFSTPNEVFPGLDRHSLLRPPSIAPPTVPGRCGETFSELLKLLQGYDVSIRNEEHRAELLRDARYFHLKGVEQRLIPCDISYNRKRSQSEIIVRLEDIRQSGISFTADNIPSSNASSNGSISGRSPLPGNGSGTASKPASPAPSINAHQTFRPGTVCYARPYTDDHSSSNVLILEISSEEAATLHFPSHPPSSKSSLPLTLDLRALFHGSTLARITSLFSVIASKMGLPATQPLGLMMMQSGGGVAAQPVSPANSGVSERRVRVRWDEDAYVVVDGEPVELAVCNSTGKLGVRFEDEDVGRKAKRRKGTRKHHGDDEEKSDDDNGDQGWVWGGSSPDLPLLSVASASGDVDADDDEMQWVVKRAQWRIRVEPVDTLDPSGVNGGGRMQVVLCPVRLEIVRSEKARNRIRGFLGR